MQAFFHRFTAWFRKDVYPEFVYVPKTREDLARVETPYALVGLPGCIGSMDVVHIAWCMCPTYLINLAKGKEGYTSIAYNVICDSSCGQGHHQLELHCVEDARGVRAQRHRVLQERGGFRGR